MNNLYSNVAAMFAFAAVNDVEGGVDYMRKLTLEDRDMAIEVDKQIPEDFRKQLIEVASAEYHAKVEALVDSLANDFIKRIFGDVPKAQPEPEVEEPKEMSLEQALNTFFGVEEEDEDEVGSEQCDCPNCQPEEEVEEERPSFSITFLPMDDEEVEPEVELPRIHDFATAQVVGVAIPWEYINPIYNYVIKDEDGKWFAVQDYPTVVLDAKGKPSMYTRADYANIEDVVPEHPGSMIPNFSLFHRP